MDTRPKEIIPEAKGRALIRRNIPFNRGRCRIVLQRENDFLIAALSTAYFTFSESFLRLRSNARKKAELRAELKRLRAPAAAVDAATLKVMKPETRERPFSRPGWFFELKYDGFRVLAAGGGGEARLFYKSGHDATRILPEITRAVAALPFDALILDGEAVVLDARGKPDFQSLQRRGLRTRVIDADRAAVTTPATYFVFDLLACEGFDLRTLPYEARRALLRLVISAVEPGTIRLSDEIAERGEDLYAAVAGLGLEGIVAKRAGSPYRSGYSPDWLKVRVDRTSDFAVVGFEPIPGARSGLRNLHLAVSDAAGALTYAGTVGSGFSSEDSREIRFRGEPARRATPPLAVPSARGVVWVEPELVVEVRYKEWTRGGNLRHPVFLRVRDDKTVEECLRPGTEGEGEEEASAAAAAAKKSTAKTTTTAAPATPRPPAFTNLDKVFWPEEGYTKGDLVEYYRAVAPAMLPFLHDRPLVLDRYPDGIAGKSFYQKNAPVAAAGRV